MIRAKTSLLRVPYIRPFLLLINCFCVLCLSGVLNAELVETKIVDRNLLDHSFLILNNANTESEKRWVTVSEENFEIYATGDLIHGNVYGREGAYFMDGLWPSDGYIQSILKQTQLRLHRDTLLRGKNVFRSVGEKIPEFALLDQNAKLVYSKDLFGNILVINFIFTRCMSPNMCPAATRRMQQLQEMIRSRGLNSIIQLSISMDPEYDTPGVLRAYAKNKGIENVDFHFLTGNSSVVEDLQQQLGILVEEDPDKIINHTMRTLIVDQKGNIVFQIPGHQWEASDLIEYIIKLQSLAQ